MSRKFGLRNFKRIVASDLRSAGRKHKARAYDALIAAIAISQALPVYTANLDDFRGISELTVAPIDVPDT